MREALEALITEMVAKGITFDEASTEFERRFLHHVLEKTGGNQSQAARMLHMHRNTLSRKLAELHLSLDGNKPAARRPPASQPAPARRLRRK